MAWKEKVKNWKRVIQIARKPGKDEFLSTSKITAIGLIIIGFVGFVIFIGAILLPQLLGA